MPMTSHHCLASNHPIQNLRKLKRAQVIESQQFQRKVNLLPQSDLFSGNRGISHNVRVLPPRLIFSDLVCDIVLSPSSFVVVNGFTSHTLLIDLSHVWICLLENAHVVLVMGTTPITITTSGTTKQRHPPYPDTAAVTLSPIYPALATTRTIPSIRNPIPISLCYCIANSLHARNSNSPAFISHSMNLPSRTQNP